MRQETIAAKVVGLDRDRFIFEQTTRPYHCLVVRERDIVFRGTRNGREVVTYVNPIYFGPFGPDSHEKLEPTKRALPSPSPKRHYRRARKKRRRRGPLKPPPSVPQVAFQRAKRVWEQPVPWAVCEDVIKYAMLENRHVAAATWAWFAATGTSIADIRAHPPKFADILWDGAPMFTELRLVARFESGMARLIPAYGASREAITALWRHCGGLHVNPQERFPILTGREVREVAEEKGSLNPWINAGYDRRNISCLGLAMRGVAARHPGAPPPDYVRYVAPEGDDEVIGGVVYTHIRQKKTALERATGSTLCLDSRIDRFTLEGDIAAQMAAEQIRRREEQ